VVATEAATPDRTRAIEAVRTTVATLDEEMDLADLEATTAGAAIQGTTEGVQEVEEATLDMRAGVVVIRAMKATEEVILVAMAEIVKRAAATTTIEMRIARATRIMATTLDLTADVAMTRISATTQDMARCADLILWPFNVSHSL
jgi:hypothetical protein